MQKETETEKPTYFLAGPPAHPPPPFPATPVNESAASVWIYELIWINI